MKQILKKLHQHQTLSRIQAREILINISNQKYNEIETASFLSVFNMRNINIEELKGFRDAMLELCKTVNLNDFDAMDLCGTGGDGKNTFNISTLSSFVVAGAGIPVAKHGNYGISSISGSSNVMEKIGVEFLQDENGLKKQLEKANICFIHAPYFHPAMKNVAPIRKQLGIKTFFNMLGPLVNPSNPKIQLVGLFDLELLRMYQYIFQDENKQFSLVHSVDGYDEISLTSDFKWVTENGENFYRPSEISTLKVTEQDLFGGNTLEEAASIFLKIINGNGTPIQNEVVLTNSAIAIKTHQSKLDFSEAKAKAEDSLFNKKALEKLTILKSIK